VIVEMLYKMPMLNAARHVFMVESGVVPFVIAHVFISSVVIATVFIYVFSLANLICTNK